MLRAYHQGRSDSAQEGGAADHADDDTGQAQHLGQSFVSELPQPEAVRARCVRTAWPRARGTGSDPVLMGPADRIVAPPRRLAERVRDHRPRRARRHGAARRRSAGSTRAGRGGAVSTRLRPAARRSYTAHAGARHRCGRER